VIWTWHSRGGSRPLSAAGVFSDVVSVLQWLSPVCRPVVRAVADWCGWTGLATGRARATGGAAILVSQSASRRYSRSRPRRAT